MRILVLLLATGLGSGLVPRAPGTVGSIVGLAIHGMLVRLPVVGYWASIAAVILVGSWAAGRAEVIFQREDDGRITVDEVAGMLVSLAWLPARLDVALAGFLMFRIFDIAKPFPVRRFERIGGGVGVMADDLMAGAYANLVGQVLWRFAFPGGLS